MVRVDANFPAMSLYWTIDSRARLVTIVADGAVSRAEADACIDAMAGADSAAYWKLFDGRKLVVSMEPEDLLAIGARLRSYHDQPLGPLAVVLSGEQTEYAARVAGIVAMADRPMRIFCSLLQARRWLSRQ
ncbi:MAG: hypothetical protein ACOY4R_01165 [Pseudomonadota bacterium]